MHDPTTLNRQGNDVGEIYRSIILYHDDEQKQIAEDMIANFAPTLYKDPIVTQLVPYDKFWPAAEYMQDYYNKNPSEGYCQVVIDPKISKLRQKFAARVKK
jgi:peptide-methionine (S)-S-oxide reductase